jgi:hypothetical protein
MIGEYLLILAVVLLVSLLLEMKYHARIYHNEKERLIIPLLFFVIGIV